MEEKNNDKRLKILQDRLKQIEKKQEVNSIITDTIKEEKNYNKIKDIKEIKDPSWGLDNKKQNKSWKKYVIILLVLFSLFYGYSHIDTLLISSNSSNDNSAKIENPKQQTDPILEYNLNIAHNYQKKAQIAIINSFQEEESAKAMVNQLRVKGFECDYFYLPENSNSQEEVFKVFIGPYESLEEVNQWKENIKNTAEIINL